MKNSVLDLQKRIKELKAEKNAAVLAHNYQLLDVQKSADYIGDSLYMAKVAKQLKEKVIVIAGVKFMAETASILSPDKTVLLPNLEAGCSLADTIKPEDIRAWREKHPDGLVVCYVNTTADVKAESDYCCTSSNSVQVVNALPKDREIFFVPDAFLGYYTQHKTGRKLHLWKGFCHVHERITAEEVDKAKGAHPKAKLLMHPECGCLTQSMHLADEILSTGGMVKFVEGSDEREFLIATEVGLIDQLHDRFSDKSFFAVGDNPTCEYMKYITLENIVESLEKMRYPISVPENIAKRAKTAIDRMISL